MTYDRIRSRKNGMTNLEIRIKEWEAMRADSFRGTHTKIISGNAYRKPGSQNPRKK